MKLDQINSTALQNLLKSGSSNRSEKSSRSNASAVSDAVSLSQVAKLGTKVVQYSLSQSLTISGKNYSAANTSETENSDTESLFDFQKVADNVLSFVTRTINARKDAGDSDDTLKSMLGEAYKGIDKGFSDARAELDKSGVLSEDLSEGIDKSYDLIQQGMQDYEKSLFAPEESNSETASTDEASESESANTTTDDSVKSAKELGNSLLAAMMGRQSANVELVTQEGDKITISFDDKQQWRLQQNQGMAKKALQAYGDVGNASQKNQSTGTAFSFSHTAQFSFKVEGDLSASELQSVSDMVNKIGDLSDLFFDGNVSDAIKQAQQLDLSDTELASMSLALYQKQLFGVAGNQSSNSDTTPTLQTNQIETSDVASSLPDNLQNAAALPDYFTDLGDYMQQLQSLFNQMIGAFNPNMQTQMQGWVASKQHPEQSDEALGGFVSFNQRMQQALSFLSSTNTDSTDANA